MIDKEDALDNLANYKNLNAIKYLLLNIYKLEKAAYAGNQTAHCILMDIQIAMTHENLTEKQRETIYQKYVVGHNNVKIAEIMGVTENAIRKHLAGAIKRIRKILIQGGR
jgi:DNA-directed RNA polymerase specialized sigma24 family protein